MNIQLLSIFIAIATLAGLAITPALTEVIPAYASKDSPSDNDQGYGNDPGNSGDAHKKNNKRDRGND